MYNYVYFSVVTVPTFLYSVPIPVKIHGSRYQRKTQKMLIKKHTIFINKNQCNSLYLSIVISMKNSKQVSPKFNWSFN